MKRARSFGVRGMSAEERAAANPYWGEKMPMGGMVASGAGKTGAARGVAMSRDEGLRRFMLNVYNYMMLGLVVTAIMAFLTYHSAVTTDLSQAAVTEMGGALALSETEYLTEWGVWLYLTPVSYLICFGPLAVLVFAGGVFRNLDFVPSMIVYLIVAAMIGVSFASMAFCYTDSSITRVFFVTAATFGCLSLFGYTTRKDLSGWGCFLWMGFFGLLVAIIANIVWPSDLLQFTISAVGVIVFAGFTAYDTQMIRDAYRSDLDEGKLHALALNGAVDLYLDFINLFRFLMSFLGEEE